MINLFKKQKTEERKPLNLPELSPNTFNPLTIAIMLEQGTAIWAWYDAEKKFNNTALLNMTMGLDAFALFRKEDDYLVKYVVNNITENNEIYLKIREICKFAPSNIMELFNIDLSDAYKVYYDDSGLTEQCRSYVHDITLEKISKHLETHRVMYVGDEHFIKKTDISNNPQIH